ncbi:MAG TPA: hypothetical protein VKG45_06280 [Actinomycetes bacterium]|nr:hypothetical protein [Actinomycetes bacterium]
MATFNALDELLPGPPSPAPSAASPPRERVLGSKRTGAFNALDELLPGPAPTPPEPPAAAGGGRMGAFNALDELFGGKPAAPPRAPRPAPARVRTTFRVSREVLKAMRDTVGQLSGSGDRITLDELAERALEAELRRLVARRPRRARRPRPPAR